SNAARRSREALHEISAARVEPSAERQAATKEVATAARHELESLPHELRAAVCLCCEEGFTVRQAAEILQVPSRTVHKRVQRALAKLREKLTAVGFAGLGLAALGEALGSPGVPPASAHLAESVGRAAARIGSAGKAQVAAAAAGRGGARLAVRLAAGIVLAGSAIAAAALLLPRGTERWRMDAWGFAETQDGHLNGPLRAAMLGPRTWALTQGPDGTIYGLAGQDGAELRIFAVRAGRVYTLVRGGTGGLRDGPAEVALFSPVRAHWDASWDLECDDAGRLYFNDMGNRRIRRLVEETDGR
ncbi:unnamed protein product, partial [marine sediment metagenome]